MARSPLSKTISPTKNFRNKFKKTDKIQKNIERHSIANLVLLIKELIRPNTVYAIYLNDKK